MTNLIQDPKLYDPLTEGITEIATCLLRKQHPELSIKSWQTKYVLIACSEFVREWENKKTHINKEKQAQKL